MEASHPRTSTMRNYRRALAHRGPITSEQLAAAEVYTALELVEPSWPLRMISSFVVVLIALSSPALVAHAVVLIYGVICAIRMNCTTKVRRRITQFLALTEAPANTGDEAQKQAWTVQCRVTLHAIMGAVTLTLIAISCIMPIGVFRLSWAIAGLWMLYRNTTWLIANRRSRRILLISQTELWYDEYAKLRHQRQQEADLARRLI